jgi:hypothetical protein
MEVKGCLIQVNKLLEKILSKGFKPLLILAHPKFMRKLSEELKPYFTVSGVHTYFETVIGIPIIIDSNLEVNIRIISSFDGYARVEDQ